MEWKEVRLGDLYSVHNGLSKAGKYFGYGYPFLTFSDVFKNYFLPKEFGNKVDSSEKEQSNFDIKRGDVFITRTSETADELGMSSVALTDVPHATYNGFTKRLRPINGKDAVLPEFIGYYLRSKSFRHNFFLLSGGMSTRASLANADLLNMSVKLPTIEDQRRIAAILSSLDRKIELNKKINAQLEEMAQAIFKSWFVDFEPFKVGADGSAPTYGSGKFVESELGMIPEGWRVGTYKDIVETTISGDWGKETMQGNYVHEVACVRGCDFQDIKNGVRGKTPQRYILEKNYNSKHLQDKDILVEISGGTATVSTGRIALVSEDLLIKYNYDIVCTNFCRVLRPLRRYSSYIYYSWNYKYDNRVMFGYENGTSGIKNFAMNDFLEKEPVIIPKSEDIDKFQILIDSLYRKIQKNGSENTYLSHLRDTLLPKLMSGEIEI